MIKRHGRVKVLEHVGSAHNEAALSKSTQFCFRYVERTLGVLNSRSSGADLVETSSQVFLLSPLVETQYDFRC